MDFFIQFFNEILYRPLFNVLVLLYEYLPVNDFGIAIIILTLLTKIIFYPLGTQAVKSQKALSGLQPKLKEIQEKYKDNKEKLAKATMELYKKEKINPFSGCLPLLIQLPILIALYKVFWKGLEPAEMKNLYSFVFLSGKIEPTFLGMVNLATPSLILAILAGIFQFFQTKMITPHQTFGGGQASKNKKGAPDFASLMQKQMLYFFPIFTVFILWKLPSAIALYWLVSSIFSIFQQYLIFRKAKT